MPLPVPQQPFTEGATEVTTALVIVVQGANVRVEEVEEINPIFAVAGENLRPSLIKL